MITNATILRITPRVENVMGQVSYAPAAGEITPRLRCSMAAPTKRQVYQLGAVLKDVTAVIRVASGELERRGLELRPGDQVEVRQDRRQAAAVMIVVHVIDTVKSGLDNTATFLRKA